MIYCSTMFDIGRLFKLDCLVTTWTQLCKHLKQIIHCHCNLDNKYFEIPFIQMQNISYQCATEQLKITIENHYSMILDDDVLLYELMNLIVRYFIL